MCNPMAFSMMQAAGQVQQGMAAREAGRAQRMIYEAQGEAERDAATAEADRIARRTRQARSSARAAAAGAGVSVDSEVTLDIDQDIAQRGAEDAHAYLLTGERRARQLNFEGRAAQRAGRQALTNSVLQAGSTVAQGWTASRQRLYRPQYEDPAPIVDRSRR